MADPLKIHATSLWYPQIVTLLNKVYSHEPFQKLVNQGYHRPDERTNWILHRLANLSALPSTEKGIEEAREAVLGMLQDFSRFIEEGEQLQPPNFLDPTFDNFS